VISDAFSFGRKGSHGTIAAIATGRIVPGVQAVIAPAQIEKPSCPMAHAPTRSNPERFLNPVRMPRGSGIFQGDNLLVEMADFEKIINAQHPGSLPPKASFQQICPLCRLRQRLRDLV
jgi:hypothetical protein